jgi:hypothetical protein
MVYALLPNKSEASYSKMSTFLSEKIISHPEFINTDFELAAINAFRSTFTKTVFNGCYFHFVQNLWKNVQNKKLVNDYNKDKTFRQSFHQLQCLAFIPHKDVIFAFKSVTINSPGSFLPMITYFEIYYIGNLCKNSNTKRKVPIFRIKCWSVYARIIKGEPRTINNLEALHNHFEEDARIHPTVNKLIQQFRLEQKKHRSSFLSIRSW